MTPVLFPKFIDKLSARKWANNLSIYLSLIKKDEMTTKSSPSLSTAQLNPPHLHRQTTKTPTVEAAAAAALPAMASPPPPPPTSIARRVHPSRDLNQTTHKGFGDTSIT